MSITYCVIETKIENGEGWYNIVEDWAVRRPDWQHKTEWTEEGDFDRHYFNIQVLNKKDLFDLIRLADLLAQVDQSLEIGWHNKVEDANVSFQTKGESLRIYGGPVMSKIHDRVFNSIKEIKELLKNY